MSSIRRLWESGRVPIDLPTEVHGVVFDVGETLVDETRMWSAHAATVGVTPFTLMAVLGSLIERGEDHRRLWPELGVDAPPTSQPAGRVDLYPDALACLRAASERGLVVGIAGNQPAGVEAQLRAAGCSPDFLASSAAWGIEKPSPDFFRRIAEEAQLPAHSILYVGDRLDNDVLPARHAGLRTAFLRRGPWGLIHGRRPEAGLADLSIDSLAELTDAMTVR